MKKNPSKMKSTAAKPSRVQKTHLWLWAGVLLIVAGMMLGGYGIINSWLTQRSNKVNAEVLKNSKPIQNSSPLITGTPTHIAIPNVGIDLNIIPGYYNPENQSWTLSLDSAQWGTMTAKPNNKAGETYIYGHYRVHVFYTLPKVKPGDEAVVTTDNGHTFTYIYTTSTTVTPEDTSLFNYKGKPILLLQTCTGVWYQYRQLFVFDLIKVDQTPIQE